MSIGSSSQRSTPVDMTPDAFKNLQQPFANVIASLLGQPFGGSGGGAAGGTGGAGGSGGSGSGQEVLGPGGIAWPTMQPQPMMGLQYGGNSGNRNAFETLNMVPMNQNTQGQDGSAGGPGSPAAFDPNDPHSVLRGIPGFQGNLVAPLGANEQTLLDQLMGQGNFGAPRDLLERTIGGEFLEAGNPFLQSAIEAAQRPTIQALEETLSRTLPGRFTQAGHMTQPQGSSAFDRAAGIATRGAADALGDIATRMSFGAHEAERGRMQEAASQLTQLTAQEVETTVQNLQAQALPRLIEELGIERGMQEFNNRMNNLMVLLQTAGGVTRPVVANQSSGSSFQMGFK